MPLSLTKVKEKGRLSLASNVSSGRTDKRKEAEGKKGDKIREEKESLFKNSSSLLNTHNLFLVSLSASTDYNYMLYSSAN